MTTKSTKPEAIVEEIYRALNDREFETAARYFAEDAAGTAGFQYDPDELRFSQAASEPTPSPGEETPSTLDGLIAVWKAESHGFPDIQYELEDIATDNGIVLVRFTASGTHENPWLGIDPRGNHFEITGHATYHIDHGTVVEFHETIDMLGVLVQIGLDIQLEPA